MLFTLNISECESSDSRENGDCTLILAAIVMTGSTRLKT